MKASVADLVEVELPEGAWRRFEGTSGALFALEEDVSDASGDPMWTRFRVCVGVVEGGGDLRAVVDGLFRRRVRQGWVEPADAIVAGRSGVRVDWVDGVADWDSYFIDHPRGAIVELSFAALIRPARKPRVRLEEVVPGILSHVRWTA
ncbi:MAG TPA: hypothetical protein VIF57_16030 [Polyangia bacterium]|jgi:hypothetical protein